MGTLNKPEDLNFLTYEDRDKFKVDADITTALKGQVFTETDDGKISPPAFPEVPTPAVEKGPSLSDTLIQYFAPKKAKETGNKFDDFWNNFRVEKKNLTGGAEETFEPMNLPLFGKFLEQKESRKVITDPSLITPYISVRETMDLNNENAVYQIMNATAGFDKNLVGGTVPSAIFSENDTLEQRINKIDKLGIVALSVKDKDLNQNYTFTIPWDNALANEISFSDKALSQIIGINIPGVEGSDLLKSLGKDASIALYSGVPNHFPKFMRQILGGTGDKDEVRKPLFAAVLNAKLIEQGVTDPRTRLGIIKYRQSFHGFGDLQNLQGVARDVARFPLQLSFMGVGEIYNLFADVVDKDNSIATSKGRSRLIDRIVLDMPSKLQNELAQGGINIDLATAEYLSRYYFNLGGRVAGVYTEAVLPSKVVTASRFLKGKREVAEFNEWYKSARANGAIPKDMPQGEAIKEYVELKIQYANNGLLSSYAQTIPLLSTLDKSKLTGKLRDGFQIEDAALPANLRAEVIQSQNLIKGIEKRIESQKNRMENIHKSGKFVGEKEKKILEDLESDLNFAQKKLETSIIKSATPKYVRDSNVSDTFVLLGGVAGGEISQNILSSNPGMGEGLGMISGILAEISKGSAFAVTRYIKEKGWSQFPRTLGKIVKPSTAAEWIAKTINSYDAEFAKGILARGGMYREIQDALLAEGGDPEIVVGAFDRILGLGTYQIISEQTRLDINVSQIKSGQIANLEEALTQQDQLLTELKNISANIGDMKPVIDPATDQAVSLQTIVDDSIKYYENQILQTKDDMALLTELMKDALRSQIYEDLGQNVARMNSTVETQLAQAIDRLIELDIVPKIGMYDVLKTIEIDAQKVPLQAISAKVKEIQTNFTTNQLALNSTKKLLSSKKEVKTTLPNGSQTNLSIEANVTPITEKGAIGGTLPVRPESMTKPHHMLNAIAEVAASVNKATAGYLFKKLDRGEFVDKNGKVISGVPRVDGGIVLDALFAMGQKEAFPDGTSLDLLKAMNNETLSVGEKSRINQIFKTYGDIFFENQALAASTPEVKVSVRDIKKGTIKSLQASLPEKEYNAIFKMQGISDDVKIIAGLRKLAQLKGGNATEIIPMSYQTLNQFTNTLKNQKNKAYKAGNFSKVEEFDLIIGQLDQLQTQFYVKDVNGNKVFIEKLSMRVKNENGEIVNVPVTQIRETANREWQQHRLIFYDNPLNSQKFAWTERSPEVVTNAANPIGVQKNVPANSKAHSHNWFNISKMTDETLEDDKIEWQSFLQMVGTYNPTTNRYELIEGTDMANAVQDVVEAMIAEHFAKFVQTDAYKKGDVFEFNQKLRNLEEIFSTGKVDQNGNPIRLVDVGKIQDQTIGWNSNTIPEEIRIRADKDFNAAYNAAFREVENNAEVVKKGMLEGIEILKMFSKTDQISDDAGKVLLDSGMGGVKAFKDKLRLGNKYTDTQVDQIVYNLVIDYIDRNTMKATGRYDVNPKNPDQLLPELEFDIEKLKEIIGFNNPQREEMFLEVLRVGNDASGAERRLNYYKRVVQFLENNKARGAELDLRGVPRPFSPESWISRFYALRRQVVGYQYVGTEALLQQMRIRNFSTLKLLLGSPEVGRIFLDMVESGVMLEPRRETQVFNMAVQALIANDIIFGKPDPQTYEDQFGREFTIYPSVSDIKKNALPLAKEFAKAEPQKYNIPYAVQDANLK